MKRTDFIKVCAEKLGITQKDMKKTVEVVCDVIIDNIKDEDGVCPFKSVKFYSKYISDHVGRNPATGEAVSIPGKYQPRVKFGDTIKYVINQE